MDQNEITQDLSTDEESISSTDEEIDEKELITFYFNRGFSYNEIIQFLAKQHNFSISYRWTASGPRRKEGLPTTHQETTYAHFSPLSKWLRLCINITLIQSN